VAAKKLHAGGYRFRGWSKELVTRLAYPAVDPSRARMPPVPPTLGPEFVSRWNKEVLLGKLAESVRQGPFDPVPLPEFYRGVAGRAGRFGLGSELLSKLGPSAPQLLQDIISPPTLGVRANRIGKSILGLSRDYRVGIGAAVGILGLYALQPGRFFSGRNRAINPFSGKDDQYNTIEGLPHRGTAGRMRRFTTDFGSGYQGDENSGSILAAIGGGVAGGGLAYSILGFKQFADDWKYPRLKKIRGYGKRGFKMVSPLFARKIAEGSIFGQFAKAMSPVTTMEELEGFRGFLYVEDPALGREMLRVPDLAKRERFFKQAFVSSLAYPAIGSDKLLTYEMLKEKGVNAQPSTLKGTADIEDLVRRWGRKNIVVKGRAGVLSEEVWMGLSAFEKSKAFARFQEDPSKFLFQKKLDLVGEYRVVTVGDKPIYTAHRWGTSQAKAALSQIERLSPGLAEAIKERQLLETTMPVFDKGLRKRIGKFASEVAGKLPYEIGGMDIGLTRAGELQLIEAQRYFGTIRHPYVMERIHQEVTRRMGPIGKGMLAGAVVLGAVGAYNLFSGKDDAYNTIEGLQERGEAGRRRKINTDFGSGWRGLFSRLIRPFTFAGRVERAYKGLLRQSFRAKGISTRGIRWDYVDVVQGKTLDITLMAKSKRGDPLAMITRSLSPGEIYLTSIEVAKRGAGLGKEIYKREAGVLRGLGYKQGTRIMSPVSNPITARWQTRLYGSRPVNRVLEDDFRFRLSKGQISHDEFTSKYAGEYVGELGFDGFTEGGLAGLSRKSHGFGSGRIWDRILTFARKLFRNPKSQSAYERMTSGFSQQEALYAFGRETSTVSGSQMRSGLHDKWFLERHVVKPSTVSGPSPKTEDLFDIFAREKQSLQGAHLAEYEAAERRVTERIMPRGGTEAKTLSRAEKIQKQQALHQKAQKDFWNGANKPGKGHISKSVNISLTEQKTGVF
jgi:hypothetical protein